MTEAQGAVETLADRIAQRGREALVDRLRKAYADAAAAHSDLIRLDGARIEAMVQSAADRADGLQWRRALANVAVEELGLSLAEALTHPAVARAQELVGAPSYEASLAELVARPVPPPVSRNGATGGYGIPVPAVRDEPAAPGHDTYAEPSPAADLQHTWPAEEELAPASPQPEAVIEEPEPHGATGELDVVEADDAVFELLPPPEPIEYEVDEHGALPELEDEPPPPLLEQVPYEPEPESGPGAAESEAAEPEPMEELEPVEPEAVEPEAAHPEPLPAGEPEYLGEPTQPHELDPVEPAFGETPAVDEYGGIVAGDPLVQAPLEAPVPDTYGAEYGGEHLDYPGSEETELRVTAYHMGGVANLPSGRSGDGLDLRLSQNGLDILQPEGEIIGRLHWNEIDSIEVNAVRGRLRRHARAQSRLVVRTKHGDASFEIPGFNSEELGARVDPLISRYASAG